MQLTEVHLPRVCLDCAYCDDFAPSGECSTCGSHDLVLAESIYQFQAAYNESVDEAERIFALPSGGR